VFFDNLQVIHTRGAMLEETHYYPYGMKMAGISAKAFSALHNPYQYQGDYSEFDETTGWNDFYLRSYDAQTGRFNGADPYDQFASPYTGMGNNPVNGTDPSGGFFDLIKNLLTGEVFDDKNIGSESAFLSSSYNNGSYMYLGEGESKFLPGVFIMANNNYSQQFAAWKFLPSSLEVGLGAGVLEWVKNTSVNAYEHSIIGGLTTSYSELEDRGNAIRGTLQSAAEFLSLPSSQSVSIAGSYLRTKLNNFINSTPYDQGRILGNVVPDLAVVAALPELKASSAGEIAAKGVSVIGPRATYREFAKKIGANFLNVTDEAWTMRKNVEFLQGVVKRGDEVIFSGKYNPLKLDPNSVLGQEIRYLQRHGYSWTDDFSRMIKK